MNYVQNAAKACSNERDVKGGTEPVRVTELAGILERLWKSNASLVQDIGSVDNFLVRVSGCLPAPSGNPDAVAPAGTLSEIMHAIGVLEALCGRLDICVRSLENIG